MKRLFFTFLGLLSLFGSCRTPTNIVYFHGVENMTEDQRAAANQKFVPVIRVDDALYIIVTAPEKTSVAPFASYRILCDGRCRTFYNDPKPVYVFS